MSVTFQLTLVRHGETEYNRQRIIQGQKDVELSSVGCQQAKLVAKRLAGERFHLAFSSDLSRAKETADTIMSTLEHKVEVQTDTLLRERGLGDAVDKPISDLVANAKGCGLSVLEYTPPNGETHMELVARTKVFFTNLITKYYPLIKSSPPMAPGRLNSSVTTPSLHVLVATHGGWIYSFLEYITSSWPGVSLPIGAVGYSPNTGVTSLLISLSKKAHDDMDGLSSSEEQPVSCTAVIPLCLHDASHL